MVQRSGSYVLPGGLLGRESAIAQILIDYDKNDDGLIEISYLEQLDAVR